MPATAARVTATSESVLEAYCQSDKASTPIEIQTIARPN